MMKKNNVIKILQKYDFVRPADQAVIKANIASKSRVYKKIVRQESGWTFDINYAYTMFSAMRNYGLTISMSTARRFARVSFAAASFIIILGGAFTVNSYIEYSGSIIKQPEIAATSGSLVPSSGMINFTVGNVKLEDTAGKITTAAAGNSITEGMKIITIGKKSAADIYFGDNAVRVTGDSSITLSKLTANPMNETRQVSITLVKGLIYNRIARKLIKDDSYSVSTGTAVAAVRGTEFAVEDIEGKTIVSCLKGKVAVNNNAGAEVLIEANEETSVVEGKDPVKTIIDENRLNRLKIISDINAVREDIREQFEQKSAEIKKAVDDRNAADTQNLDNQKNSDASLIEKLKAESAKNTADMKPTGETLNKPVNSVKAQMDALKKKPVINETKTSQ